MKTLFTTKRDKEFLEIMGKDFTHGTKYAFSLLVDLMEVNDYESIKEYVKEHKKIAEKVYQDKVNL